MRKDPLPHEEATPKVAEHADLGDFSEKTHLPVNKSVLDSNISLAQAKEIIAARERTIAELLKKLMKKEEEVMQLLTQIGELSPLSQELAVIKTSTSWRITLPFRMAGKVAKWPFSSKRIVSAKRLVLRFRRSLLGRAHSRDLPQTRAKSLEDKLWGGFSQYALQELEALKQAETAGAREVADAGWALACWYASEGKYNEACVNASTAREAAAFLNYKVKLVLVEAYCRLHIGEREIAQDLLGWALKIYPEDPNLHLAMANTYVDIGAPSDHMRLSWINNVYQKAGLLTLAKLDQSRPLTLDNLTAVRTPDQAIANGAKVSIIMPVYNAQETLAFTLRGLLAQTWQNIEIIVVDDCSSDGTLAVADEFAQRDPRIKVLKQQKNLGAYSARNKGLEFANGELITVHDANDWSHPQKIEIQACHILGNENVIGNYSKWSRALNNMTFTGKFRRKDKIIDWNPSSFLFRREVLIKVGGWDPVRISADAEFIRRVRKCFPSMEIKSAFDLAPLAFALDSDESLTRYSATHGKTVHHGLRREYQEAATYWAASAQEEDLNLAHGGERRRFPVPGRILPQREEKARCDVLFIDDFNRSDGGFELSIQNVHAAIAQGRAVAVFHWPHYETDVTRPLNFQVRRLAQEGSVRIIAPGEKVKTSIVIVSRYEILRHAIDLCPDVEFNQLFVLTNGTGAREVADEQKRYDPENARTNLTKLFGTSGAWIPADDAKHLVSQAAVLGELSERRL